jgi:hypothetical protein
VSTIINFRVFLLIREISGLAEKLLASERALLCGVS